MEEKLFENASYQEDKLINYGFQKENGNYIYKKNFHKNEFCIIITITNQKVYGTVFDLNTKEEYLGLHVTGSFHSQIKEEYQEILKDIYDSCFEKETYLYPQTKRMVQKIEDIYQVKLEFLWEKYPNYGVFRNPFSKKWFGIIMNVDWSKLDAEKQGEIEILNIRVGDVSSYLENKGVYEAYHMSKKYWISITLNDTIRDEELLDWISISYQSTKKGDL